MDEDDEDSNWSLINAIENLKSWLYDSDGCKVREVYRDKVRGIYLDNVSDVYWDDDINDWAAIAEKDGKEYLLTLDSDGDIQVSPEI